MKTRLRLEGIYSPETIDHIEQREILDLGFDFRPKSFNFLQHYKFLEILEEKFSSRNQYWLHFENEHPDIIKKLLVDAKEVLSKKGIAEDPILLEFSDNQSLEYYDSFNQRFSWNYVDLESLEKVIQSKNLEVLIIPFTEIEHLHNTGRFQEFVSMFHKKTFKAMHDNKIKLALKTDWDSDLFPSLFEYINFDFCSIPVNGKIESSFRSIDWVKFDSNLDYYQNLDF